MLDEIKILDFTRLLPGPYATMLLRAMGARVIKVEDLSEGDYLRWVPPHGRAQGIQFDYLNRGKKSLAVNLKDERGRIIIKNLARVSHAVVEQFRPGVMEKLGLGYEDLKKENPHIVYCSITGYGQTGNFKMRAGHDLNYISLAGILNLNRDKTPVIPPVQIGDLTGALFAALLITGALLKAKLKKEGSYIDISMLETSVSFFSVHLLISLLTGENLDKKKMHLGGGVICYNIYETKDGRFFTLAALEPKFWKSFIDALSLKELENEQFSPAEDGNPSYEKMKEIFRSKTIEEWEEFFSKIDSCASPVREISEVINCPHLQERGFIKEDELEKGFYMRVPGIPGLGERGFMLGPAPVHGEHTVEILEDLGYNKEEIETLIREGVIKDGKTENPPCR